MPEVEARELKLTGDMAHVLARGREEIHAALGECLGLGLRKIALIADRCHDRRDGGLPCNAKPGEDRFVARR